jgi:hypothetical protein
VWLLDAAVLVWQAACGGCVTAFACLVQIPELSIPLHTLIELEPRPDGTMLERRFKVNIKAPIGQANEVRCGSASYCVLVTAVGLCSSTFYADVAMVFETSIVARS